jgi:hypothetical protein
MSPYYYLQADFAEPSNGQRWPGSVSLFFRSGNDR